MIRRYDGSLLSEREKARLAARLIPTTHGLARVKERCPDINLVKAIVDSPLVYWNQYGYIVVALPKEQSLIISHDYCLITLRNPSNHMYSNADRWLLTRWRATTGRRCH